MYRCGCSPRSADASAAQVIADTEVGDYTDLDDAPAWAKGCDVVTFDHEHVPTGHLETLAADGVACRPGPAALVHAQDKAVMRRRLGELGVPCPRNAVVASRATSTRSPYPSAAFRSIVKTARGGYDGKGVWLVEDSSAAEAVLAEAPNGIALLAEERVDFVRELSALVARSPSGQVAAYPVVESVQRDGICVEVVAPAPGLEPGLAVQAQQIAMQIAAELDVTGILAVELFETRDGRVLVNELAMRPHNTGHWSIDGAVTSQFENHLRAVLDLPLGTPLARAPWTVMVNILRRIRADPVRRLPTCPGARPGGSGSPLRQDRQARAQGRARHGVRRRPRRRHASEPATRPTGSRAGWATKRAIDDPR